MRDTARISVEFILLVANALGSLICLFSTSFAMILIGRFITFFCAEWAERRRR